MTTKTQTTQTTKSTKTINVDDVKNITLKKIYDDIMNANENSTLTTKKMRAKLRVVRRTQHEHNSTWLFSQNEYDEIRAMFDANYANEINAKQQRDAKKQQRVAKKQNATTTTTNDANDATNDA